MFGPVEWTAEQIKDVGEYFANLKQPVEIYASHVSAEHVNIFHVHLPPIAEQPTFEAKLSQYPEAMTDSSQKTADTATVSYKATITEHGDIKAVSYFSNNSTGPVKHVVINYATNEIIDVSALNFPNVRFARIQSIPAPLVIGPEATKPMEQLSSSPQHETILACKHRHAENLLGYVDVELIPDQEDKPTNYQQFSVPICECKKDATGEGFKWVTAKIEHWNKAQKDKGERILTKVKEAITSYQSNSGSKDTTKMKALLEECRGIEGEIVALPDNDLSADDAVLLYIC